MKGLAPNSLIVLSILAVLHIVTVQGQKIPTKSADSMQEKKIKFQVYFMGYFYLPDGFKAYKTESFIDAWFGYIVSPDGVFRMSYSAGMVTRPFADGETKYLWVKSEIRGKVNLKYGLRRGMEGEEIVAELPGMNFYAAVHSQHDIDQFLEIVRSYKVGRCADCERAVPDPSTQQTPAANMSLLKEREKCNPGNAINITLLVECA